MGSTMSAASANEITRAALHLTNNGYSVEFHESGHLIVQDPVHSIHGKQLVCSGYKPVAIRSMRDASRFITDRK